MCSSDLEDSSQAERELLGVLYARDRGASVEAAMKSATDVHGFVDEARMGAILAGQGFVKDGLTWKYGETRSRDCGSWGTGVFQGGGQQGPVGRCFVARDEQVLSLPLREEARSGRQVGAILGARSLGGAFLRIERVCEVKYDHMQGDRFRHAAIFLQIGRAHV